MDGAPRAAVLNIGIRPTFDGARESVEVHIPGWESDLYGRILEVELLAKIRDERKFPSLDDLKAQIARDVAAAIEIATRR